MSQAFSSPSPESGGSGASAQFKRKRETNKKKGESIKRMAEDDDTSFFDKSLEILSNYRETGLPVSTYWEALGLIKQKTSHEAYWLCGANDEDRLYWLMKITPKESIQAFQDWKTTVQAKPCNDQPKIKKEIDDDNVILVDDPAVPSHITLKVKGNYDGKTVYFKINPHARMGKLMQAYRDHVNCRRSLVFLFGGRRLRDEQTPNQMEMVDGDEIDAMAIQWG